MKIARQQPPKDGKAPLHRCKECGKKFTSKFARKRHICKGSEDASTSS